MRRRICIINQYKLFMLDLRFLAGGSPVLENLYEVVVEIVVTVSKATFIISQVIIS